MVLVVTLVLQVTRQEMSKHVINVEMNFVPHVKGVMDVEIGNYI